MGLKMFHEMFWGFPWFGGFFWIVILVIGVLLLTKRNHNNIQLPIETPLDILKKRYAKGEINKEQFEQMKKDIQ